MNITFGSVCSGIEAASVAWEPLGWKAAWLSEIEKFPCEVLKHHYPSVPNYGDMALLAPKILSQEIFAPDVFCGGTPCQAFSVAGLRKSLDDERGNLSLTFCEIANAIDTIRRKQRKPATIVFWENVPGVLNTKDNAFGCFLGALAGENEALQPPRGRWENAGFVDGVQRAVAWRVLDAQYFGVAQRRRRVFVVASARDDFDPAAVLFEFEGVRRDIAPSRETGQRVAPCVTNGPPFSRTGNERVECEAMVVQPFTVGNTLTARMHKGINSTLDEGQTPILALQDVSGREKAQNGKGWSNDGVSYTIDAAATQGVAQPIHYRKSRRAQSENDHETWVEDDATNTLNCFDLGDVRTVEAVVQAIDYEYNAHGVDEPTGPLLKGSPTGGGHPLPAVMEQMAVRRLTPVECERLQGFPDDYTNIKENCPDGPRYKALGNSWAVPVVRWIGARIDRALA
jgi:DNA (cytosine-5)-methyltransferase 1